MYQPTQPRKTTNWDRFLQIFAYILPFLLSFFAIILSVYNKKPMEFQFSFPFLLMIFIFLSVVYIPNLMPNFAIFILGLLYDSINMLEPLGASSLLLLIFSNFLLRQRFFLIKESFKVIWGIFCLCVVAFIFIRTSFYSIYMLSNYFNRYIIFEILFTIAFYPFFHYFFLKIMKFCQKQIRIIY